MKIAQLPGKTRFNPTNHSPRSKRLDHVDDRLIPASQRPDKNRIQWPTPHELDRVSLTLTKVARVGKRRELDGDYFKSGDLAYQLHEIIRTTNELLKKVQPNKAMPSPHRQD